MLNKLIIVLLLSFSTLATDQVKYVNKGDSVPYNGYLFSPKSELRIRTKVKNLEHKLETMGQLSVVKDKRLELYKSSYEEATKELSKQQVKSYLWTIGGFTIGIGLSAIAVYSMKKVLR